MLNNKSKLFFPKIIYDKSIQIEPSNSQSKIANLYYLDWTRKELKCNTNSPRPDLPHNLDDKVKNLKFMIDNSYLDEIRRTSWQAIAELNQIRSITDKSMKRIYLKPAASYIETAFKLLADTTFDEDTEYYYRQHDKIIIPYLLLYKFWKGQIAKNLILEFANIPELMVKTSTDEQRKYADDFLSYVNKDMEAE